VKILFVCVENAGRSQMAEAFAKSLGLEALSAGTVPAARVHPVVVQVMRERGLDISQAAPKMLTVEMIKQADLVVTMGCSVERLCPRPMVDSMRRKLIDWKLEDPKNQPVQRVRKIRDEIERRVVELSNGRLPQDTDS
jgi:protein-tyrosine-phosphatase